MCVCMVLHVEKLHPTSYEQNGIMLQQVSEDLFGYPKFSSVTYNIMLFELKLPTFNTLLHNHRKGFLMQCMHCNNSLVNRIIQVLWTLFCSIA